MLSRIGKALGRSCAGGRLRDRRPRAALRPDPTEELLHVAILVDLGNPLSVRALLRYLREQGIGAEDLAEGGDLLPGLEALWRDAVHERDRGRGGASSDISSSRRSGLDSSELS